MESYTLVLPPRTDMMQAIPVCEPADEEGKLFSHCYAVSADASDIRPFPVYMMI